MGKGKHWKAPEVLSEMKNGREGVQDETIPGFGTVPGAGTHPPGPVCGGRGRFARVLGRGGGEPGGETGPGVRDGTEELAGHHYPGEFAQLAIRYLAAEHGYEDDAAFVNDYLTYNRDRNGGF